MIDQKRLVQTFVRVYVRIIYMQLLVHHYPMRAPMTRQEATPGRLFCFMESELLEQCELWHDRL